VRGRFAPSNVSAGDQEREAELSLPEPEAPWGITSLCWEDHLTGLAVLPLSSLRFLVTNKEILFWKKYLTLYNNSLKSPGQSWACWLLADRKQSHFRPKLGDPCPHFRCSQELCWGAETHRALRARGDPQLRAVWLPCPWPALAVPSSRRLCRPSLPFPACSWESCCNLSHVLPGAHLISH